MRAIVLATSFILIAGPSLAQAPTPQEQAACRSDGMRLCSGVIGRPAEMRACLVQNRASLSPACRAVIDARGG
ncbi:MAG: hypothetical protein ACK4M0_02700 [Phreatobacter sp.]